MKVKSLLLTNDGIIFIKNEKLVMCKQDGFFNQCFVREERSEFGTELVVEQRVKKEKKKEGNRS